LSSWRAKGRIVALCNPWRNAEDSGIDKQDVYFNFCKIPNDRIVATASLVVGVAAANASHGNILLTGVAGLVAGAMSMAAGEFVSVHSQADNVNLVIPYVRHRTDCA